MSFIGKISALLSSIPTPVIGGISIALFGVIASSGLKILVENKIDFDNKENLLIASVILVSGIGGLTLQVAGLQITGVAFSTLQVISCIKFFQKRTKNGNYRWRCFTT